MEFCRTEPLNNNTAAHFNRTWPQRAPTWLRCASHPRERRCGTQHTADEGNPRRALAHHGVDVGYERHVGVAATAGGGLSAMLSALVVGWSAGVPRDTDIESFASDFAIAASSARLRRRSGRQRSVCGSLLVRLRA